VNVARSIPLGNIGSWRLPSKVHCPVCAEPLLLIPLKGDELLSAPMNALASTKISCGCGVEGVFVLKKTREGYHLYSMTFWILPKAVEKGKTLSMAELREWLKKKPEPFHA